MVHNYDSYKSSTWGDKLFFLATNMNTAWCLLHCKKQNKDRDLKYPRNKPKGYVFVYTLWLWFMFAFYSIQYTAGDREPDSETGDLHQTWCILSNPVWIM